MLRITANIRQPREHVASIVQNQVRSMLSTWRWTLRAVMSNRSTYLPASSPTVLACRRSCTRTKSCRQRGSRSSSSSRPGRYSNTAWDDRPLSCGPCRRADAVLLRSRSIWAPLPFRWSRTFHHRPPRSGTAVIERNRALDAIGRGNARQHSVRSGADWRSNRRHRILLSRRKPDQAHNGYDRVDLSASSGWLWLGHRRSKGRASTNLSWITISRFRTSDTGA